MSLFFTGEVFVGFNFRSFAKEFDKLLLNFLRNKIFRFIQKCPVWLGLISNSN